jgi:hypothetical protein
MRFTAVFIYTSKSILAAKASFLHPLDGCAKHAKESSIRKLTPASILHAELATYIRPSELPESTLAYAMFHLGVLGGLGG